MSPFLGRWWVRGTSRPQPPSHPDLSSSSVPSQPPENVRALSITSDVVVISWSEPPRSTLNGVLKGYRIIFWSLYMDGGELVAAGKENPLLGSVLVTKAVAALRAFLPEGVSGVVLFSPLPPQLLPGQHHLCSVPVSCKLCKLQTGILGLGCRLPLLCMQKGQLCVQ